MKREISATSETSEISIKLEQYDDIFSDFDIRPYSKRALSMDFLDEIKRATLDKNIGIELSLYVPKKMRDESHEAIIKERLAAHFKRHFHLLSDEKRKVKRKGTNMAIIGVVCMLAAAIIYFKDPSQSVFLSFLIVFLEPAAWFLLWEGMDLVIFDPKELNPDVEFYRKMSASNGNTHFHSY